MLSMESISSLFTAMSYVPSNSVSSKISFKPEPNRTTSNYLLFGINYWSLSPVSCLSGASTAASVLHEAGINSLEREKNKELPKIDKSGRFCSPRAARELALMIVYASCLEGTDPVRLFEKRINAKREAGYVFEKGTLLEYDHMSFGGPPVSTSSLEEANDLLSTYEKESAVESEVLSAPPKLVYSKLLLRFTRKLLVAVVEKWDNNVLLIGNVAPTAWKETPAGKILELCILHMALSEITVLGTRHQIVINEAVDLAKRFCDGAAPRIVNGCLRSLMKNVSENSVDATLSSR